MRPGFGRAPWVVLLVATALGLPTRAPCDATDNPFRCPTPLARHYYLRVDKGRPDGSVLFRGLFVTTPHHHVPLDLALQPLSGFHPVYEAGAPSLSLLDASLILQPLRNGWPIGDDIACPNGAEHGQSICKLPRGHYLLSVRARDCSRGLFYTPEPDLRVRSRVRGRVRDQAIVGLEQRATENVTGLVSGLPADTAATVTVTAYATAAPPDGRPRPMLCQATATVTTAAPMYTLAVPHGSMVDVVAAVSGKCGATFRAEQNDEPVDATTVVDLPLVPQPLLTGVIAFSHTTTTTTSSSTSSTVTSTTAPTSTTVFMATTSTTSTTTTVSTTTTATTSRTTSTRAPVSFGHIAFPTDDPSAFFDGATEKDCPTGPTGAFSVHVPPNSDNVLVLRPMSGDRGSLPFQTLQSQNPRGANFFSVQTEDSTQEVLDLRNGCPISGRLQGSATTVRIYGFDSDPRCHPFLAGEDKTFTHGHRYGFTVLVKGDHPHRDCPGEFGPTTTTSTSTTSTSVRSTSTTTTSTTLP